jgi:hypothetical protein
MAEFFEWWRGLYWGLRLTLALVVLLCSTILFWFGYRPFWRICAVGYGVGLVMLFLALPSGPEKKGYHDF